MARFHHATLSGIQLKVYELITSGTFQLIFLGFHWPWVTETWEIIGKGERLYSRASIEILLTGARLKVQLSTKCCRAS